MFREVVINLWMLLNTYRNDDIPTYYKKEIPNFNFSGS